MEVILENTAQRRSWRPNFSAFVPWLGALPQWQIRLLVALVGLPFLIPAFLLNGGINLMPMLATLAILIWRAPWLREKIQTLPGIQSQMVISMLVMGLGFIAFSAPWLWGTLPLNKGLMFLLSGLSTAARPNPMFVKMAKQMAAAKPKQVKPKPVKAAKTKPPTNTQRKLNARIARQAAKKKK
ncbi:hypothetical protein A3K29_05790 [Candidatus Collierbacteria bacterium RIFOXYB2_FULL_46_14]|nr:MAG: hypothetical protein A3K29_05790 [Candidatus Collierbacteria bacterium RIFOXYB2_FULL_46_14]OGD76643.1 MAG: hypothetical protein A3K43_05790 [Candidatus Collierbacteria bacterium RIFOXYA2_FULL_46_20]OGD77979.1 MAG: hypothetical protein A3K39_05790 [Candidatus Collierbacteria bacterium RIFOXYC2_FULL_43_15]OGD80003.1 MAG: hypothetical protein A2320_00220 [Pseudomonadales bacterium GWC2_63_15]OGD82701.1 MAG: hypothetical protein A3K36_05790 [Candidatus Collierbacteria bacterium RIFOXYD2_FUL